MARSNTPPASKFITARAAADLIRPRDALVTSGFVGTGTPEALIKTLEQRFLRVGAPFELTLVFAAAPGDGDRRGANRLAHAGLLKRVIGGHWGLVPRLGELALDNRIEAYNLPLGILSALFREIAGKRGGLLSKIGLGTFVDPRQQGGRLNSRTWEPLVDVHELCGEEWLHYRPFPLDVAFIRGTSADPSGNITMEREALTLDNLAIATAVHNAGGIVIAQVERTVPAHTFSPRDVEVPGILVDHVVVAAPEDHRQTWSTSFDPALAGQSRRSVETTVAKLDVRKVIARRAALELVPGSVVNLGIGMPEGVAQVAGEEGMLDTLTLTAEPGVIGGMPQGGLDFGTAVNNDCVLRQNQQFDFYDGGGLDIAILGMAEADARGHVNVSQFGTKLAGAGGFINISQTAETVVFTGTFSAGGFEAHVEEGKLCIDTEGRVGKFVEAVQQITFNGPRAVGSQRVLYVTERCVFGLTHAGLQLLEVAPGVDIKRDVLDRLPFAVNVDAPVLMDERLFLDEPMGLGRTLGIRAASDGEPDEPADVIGKVA